jgi:4-hydroxy-tetrahydrodipicolinate synthase
VNAVVVSGHAGEVTSLDRDERTHVIETARRVAGPAVGVVADIIADDARMARRLARDAERAGADAILLFPPVLFALGAWLRPEMARAFVGEVAKATPLPIVIFQFAVGSGLGHTLGRLPHPTVRPPLLPLPPAEVSAIAAALAAAGLGGREASVRG